MKFKVIKHRLNNAKRIISEKGIVRFLIALYSYFWKTPIGAFLFWLPRGRIFWRSENGWALYPIMNGHTWYMPQARDNYRFKPGRFDGLQEIYFKSEYVSVNDGDTVFDIGAYIGVTSVVAAEMGKQVYAIEPSPAALPCLRKNIKYYDNIDVIDYAMWDDRDTIRINHGLQPSEDSLISPDDGGITESSVVTTQTIESLLNELNIDVLQFLKVEAEGVEPEICQGIGNANVEKISVACGEERYGDDVQDEVAEILCSYGYDVYKKPNHPDKMVYAVQ